MYQLQASVLEFHVSKEVNDFDPEKLFSCFRSLRNLCTTGLDIQSDLCQSKIFHDTIIILDKIIEGYNEIMLPPLKQGLQFVYNLSINNEENKSILRTKYSYFKRWMSFRNEESVRNYVCGTVYNVVLNSKLLSESVCDISLMNSIMDSAIKGAEYPQLFIELIFQCKGKDSEQVLLRLFEVEESYHCYLLNLLYKYVKVNDIDQYYIEFIKRRYHKKVSLAVTGSYGGGMFQEIFVLLKILLELSIKIQVLPIFQSDPELFDATKHLLEFIHLNGKNSDSEFAPTDDIFPERSEVENIKSNLIRLLANLCWRNRTLQDRIRETGGLPIVLESCVRDGKNPFITETAIFAIRNVCEYNVQNQNFIRNLNSEIHDEIVERMKNRSSLYFPS